MENWTNNTVQHHLDNQSGTLPLCDMVLKILNGSVNKEWGYQNSSKEQAIKILTKAESELLLFENFIRSKGVDVLNKLMVLYILYSHLILHYYWIIYLYFYVAYYLFQT